MMRRLEAKSLARYSGLGNRLVASKLAIASLELPEMASQRLPAAVLSGGFLYRLLQPGALC
jgi:hypothetical protein